MKSFNLLKVGDYIYEVNFFLGMDMKFLVFCVGIEAASSNY